MSSSSAIGICVGLAIVFAGIGLYLLPANCAILGSNVPGPFMRDGFVVGGPDPCKFCREQSAAFAAQLVFWFGCGLFIVAGWLGYREGNRKKPEIIPSISDDSNA